MLFRSVYFVRSPTKYTSVNATRSVIAISMIHTHTSFTTDIFTFFFCLPKFSPLLRLRILILHVPCARRTRFLLYFNTNPVASQFNFGALQCEKTGTHSIWNPVPYKICPGFLALHCIILQALLPLPSCRHGLLSRITLHV